LKKKGILILAVILLSSIMIYFSKDLQRTAQDKLVEKNTTEKNKSKANFIIYDEVSGKEIYSSKVEYDGSKNLATYTKEILKVAGISYSINSSGYASMINDLYDYPTMSKKEGKKDWTSCGWVFYINGTKASIGPKDYKPKEEDIVTWRYWKDAMYEK
jgi:hypothetical protein